MKKYTFDTPQKSVILKDGKTRCFYNETTSERPIIRPTREVAAEQGEAESETETEYAYEAVDITGPVTKGTLTDALIRNATLTITEGSTKKQVGPYSQSDVEALMRHKMAGDSGATAEFKTFNLFAEACKATAVQILGDGND